MKLKPEIPKCKQCGQPLYSEERFFYDKRKKYCAVCAEERKRDKDAERMKQQREQRRNERTEQIESLKKEANELRNKCKLLIDENDLLRKQIIRLRRN